MKNNESLIPNGFPKDEESRVARVSVEYCQEADSCADGLNFLRMRTEDAGGGTYFVIKTKRWAFDDIDELIEVLNDFKARMKTDNNKPDGI